ncbi:MAG: diaminopimelate decarboxylase [Isosphaeraceae bacterium]
MDPFHYDQGQLYCEQVPIARLAEQYGTPLYVYSEAAFVGQLKALHEAFAALDPLVCYSVKASSNLGILRLLAGHGSGFDVVSQGELLRVKEAGGDPGKTVFAGVGKTDEEIAAGLDAGVLMFNVESEAELEAIARVAAARGVKAPVAPRINPDVDPKTHRYISTGNKQSKFGMDIERSIRLAEAARDMPSIAMIGMHMHIGSQITTVEPYAKAVARGVEVIGRLRELGHPIAWYNIGGGYGIAYRGPEAKAIREFADVIVPAVKSTGCRLALEPGRVIAGNAGLLVSRVIFTKQSGDKRFLIQDAAMNDLIRPSLYEAFHPDLARESAQGDDRAAQGLRGRPARQRTVGHRRPRLRIGRLPGQGPPLADDGTRRPARHLLGRRVWDGDGLELQHQAPGRRGARGGRSGQAGPTPRDLRRPAGGRADLRPDPRNTRWCGYSWAVLVWVAPHPSQR